MTLQSKWRGYAESTLLTGRIAISEVETRIKSGRRQGIAGDAKELEKDQSAQADHNLGRETLELHILLHGEVCSHSCNLLHLEGYFS